MPDDRPLPVVFFRTAAGNEPVRTWLKALPAEERRIIGEDLKTLQFRWPLGMPLVRSLGDGLWELRSTLPGRIARCLFLHTTRPHHRAAWLHQENTVNTHGGQGSGLESKKCPPQS
jgi:phage-related protein